MRSHISSSKFFERNFNILQDSNGNEEFRQLKDFKALISEKNVPRSIKLLKRSMLFLPLFLLVIICKEVVQ
jgi:hypothetical protein